MGEKTRVRIQSSSLQSAGMGGSDAHQSFFAHLSHLGPSGGDFKASRRNCISFAPELRQQRLHLFALSGDCDSYCIYYIYDIHKNNQKTVCSLGLAAAKTRLHTLYRSTQDKLNIYRVSPKKKDDSCFNDLKSGIFAT